MIPIAAMENIAANILAAIISPSPGAKKISIRHIRKQSSMKKTGNKRKIIRFALQQSNNCIQPTMTARTIPTIS